MGQCTATSKRSKERCKRFCTPGKKVCCIHGGKSNGAPKGNKNAFKHGACEAISFVTMTEEEIAYTESITMDTVAVYEEQLKILRVRELRLLKRIRTAMENEKKAGQEDETGKKVSAFVVIGGTQTVSKNPDGGQTNTVSTQNESHAMNILRLENALTQVQDHIRRVVDNIAKLREVGGEEEKPAAIEIRVVNGRREA